MKSFGACLSFTRERNVALIDAFRHHARNSSRINLHDIGIKIVNSPAPRFWVSEERATSVISAILRNKPILDSMRPTKRKMFLEIHRRVLNLKKIHPDRNLSDIIFEVVNSPAPEFYMEPSSALEILFKIRSKSKKSKNQD